MRVRGALVLISFTALAAAGCTTGGTATPGTTSAQGATTTETSKSAPRPREVKLNGIDECKTLTDAQKQELKIDSSASNPLDVAKTGNPAPTCRYRSNKSPSFSYNLSLVTDKGIDFWAEGGNLEVKTIEVAGFPAKQVKLAGTSDVGCSAAVDTADGQHMYVTFLPIGKGFSPDEQCASAKKGAELALATIETLR